MSQAFSAPQTSLKRGLRTILSARAVSSTSTTRGQVNAAFVELSLPFAENVETQVALRYEDYGGNIGGDYLLKSPLAGDQQRGHTSRLIFTIIPSAKYWRS